MIGGLAEDHLPDSSLGPLFTTILMEQFKRLRAGDRFWYENDPTLTVEDKVSIKSTKLADIIRRNTGIKDIQDDVFLVT
ncbi:peroxidase family protein [Bacillus atrophaeus]|nr:peroxidase family protein [Bacillus atrophaeus]MEC0852680.1 peroxidase family protein [Bacillus atrophaeus]MEC0859592.1 peroxidase family protein [Bacillus atrophaeus]MEC0862399.1 peroxidase family protein [Bacillus atrophaeus]MEC0868675.1 peroxidase family protein [Bacillus atrophaeus]